MDVGGVIGKGIGVLLAPAAALGGLIRGKRLFHPYGVVYRADVRAVATEGALGSLAHQLVGPALVRLSGGLREAKPGESPRDVLGVALRFQTTPVAEPDARWRVQDMLLASFRRVWQLPIAMLVTNSTDFLANDYYALLPFRVGGLGKVEFRLVPLGGQARELRIAADGVGRNEKLALAVAVGAAVFRLEVQQQSKKGSAKVWKPLVNITLKAKVDVDQEALRFNPFHDGAGIVPVGFLQGLRWAVYPASQIGRAIGRRLRGRRR
jgi:hypothetical protein